MKKLLSILVLSLLLSGNAYADDGKAVSHGGVNELPEDARPNDATISLFEERKKRFIDNLRRQGRLYIIEPKGNAKNFNFEKNLISSKLEKQLSKGFLLSYLFYDNGVVKYDGKAKDGRFKEDINNETLFFTHSTGKSITSYIVGHAICDGYISSIDEIIEKDLYKEFYMHGTSHWLGLDVHDTSPYTLNQKDIILEPGMIFTVEPGLYFSNRSSYSDKNQVLSGTGVRIEDDILVTEYGHINLSTDISYR